MPSQEARHHSQGCNCSGPAANAFKVRVMGGQKTPDAAQHSPQCLGALQRGSSSSAAAPPCRRDPEAWLELKCLCATLQARPRKWAG